MDISSEANEPLDNIFQEVQAWMKNMASLTNLGLGHGPMI